MNASAKSEFVLGMYERPRSEQEWRAWIAAGIDLVRCSSRDHLDEAREWGASGWVSIPLILADDDDGAALAERVDSLRDHPALAVWECPDEALWWAWRLVPGQPTRFWAQPPEVQQELRAKMDALVRGLERGSAIVRQRDPGRRIWLNEACKSDQDSLARCLPFLDIVGFDYYPVPLRPSRPMEHMGRFCGRFRRTAPTKDLWVVEQAFAWASLDKDSDDAPIYPTTEECRFVAWQAIAHGATGLLWWGSSHEGRPLPFLDSLMSVVSELRDLRSFLAAGALSGVSVRTDHRRAPENMGVCVVARRTVESSLVALINQDPYEHDAILSGLDWIDPAEMRPVIEPSADLVRLGEGYVTVMQPYEVRLYVSR